MAQRGSRGVRYGEQPRDGGDDHEHDRDKDRSRHHHRGGDDEEESGDNPARQSAIIAQRWVGSRPPTQELYARACQQWLKLPGAVSQPAAGVRMPLTRPLSAASDQDDEENVP